jgi:DNA polymerase III subunit gamma/tau
VVEPVETTPELPAAEPTPGVVEAAETTPPEPTAESIPEPIPESPERAPVETPAPPAGGGTSSGLGLVDVRRLWPDLLEAVKLKRRYTWILLSQNAQIAAVDDKTLTIALVNAGARNSFSSGGSEEILRQAAIDVIGHDWRIEAIVDPSAQPGAEPPLQVNRPAVPEKPVAPAPEPAAAAPEPEAPARRPVDPESIATARGAIQDTRPAGDPRQGPPAVSDEDVDRDDPDADDHTIGGAQLLERELGASIIEEIPHD